MKRIIMLVLVVLVSIAIPGVGLADDTFLNFSADQLVQANDVNIVVGTNAVPSFVDWNNDGLRDLIVGDGSGRVRIYLNVGSQSNPKFSNYFYAQSNGSDLYCPPSCCLGCFPRVVFWDEDSRKDLLVGQADGTVKIFLNIGSDNDPNFDAGALIMVGSPGSQELLNVGYLMAAPELVDWNNDGAKDLVVGAYDGRIHVYINCGCGGGTVPPSFWNSPYWGTPALENGLDLLVPSASSSQIVFDLDGDNKKDILTGNAYGQVLFYKNVGTAAEPNFSGYSLVNSNGRPIDLIGDWARSRPFLCYWTDDAYPDIILGGALDGKVHLFQGIPITGDMDGNGKVDFVDFAFFSLYWQQKQCGQCSGADLTGDEIVDANDLRLFAENWLTGAD